MNFNKQDNLIFNKQDNLMNSDLEKVAVEIKCDEDECWFGSTLIYGKTRDGSLLKNKMTINMAVTGELYIEVNRFLAWFALDKKINKTIKKAIKCSSTSFVNYDNTKCWLAYWEWRDILKKLAETIKGLQEVVDKFDWNAFQEQLYECGVIILIDMKSKIADKIEEMQAAHYKLTMALDSLPATGQVLPIKRPQEEASSSDEEISSSSSQESSDEEVPPPPKKKARKE